jgi:hypothetical protein
MSPDSFTRKDLMMNKKYILVLAIIFIFIVVIDTGVYSWSRQNIKRQKEETVGWLYSSVLTDWNESCSIQKIDNGNYQADSRIILLTGIREDEGKNVSQPEIKIMVEEIDHGSEKQPHYDILVDLNTEYIASQDWKAIIVNEEEKYPPKFKITEGQIDCTITSSESDLLYETAKRSIDGRIYCIESTSEGAAGTIYTQYIYSTMKSGSLITVSCVIRYPQCMNYRPHCEKYEC